jgi:hypothetical protein
MNRPLRGGFRLARPSALVAILVIIAGVAPRGASADFIDLRLAWNYQAFPSPYRLQSHNRLTDGYNEFLGTIGGGQTQQSGDDASHLVDFLTKAPTNVSVSWSGWDSFNGNGPAAFSANTDWVLRDITGAQIDGRNTTPFTSGAVTFASLPSGPYKVEFVMTGVNATTWAVRIGGAFANHTFQNTPSQNAAVGAWRPSTNGTQQRDWLIWDNVAVTSGSLTITAVSNGAADTSGLAALRISSVSVPEPGSVVLLGLGAGLIVIRGLASRAPRGVRPPGTDKGPGEGV